MSIFKELLNDKQDEACSYTEGPLLILAGAGSGKTRVITYRIACLIQEKDVRPYNILAITFTNKAAQEMRERVDKIVGIGSEAIWVSTFHSMCVRILRRHHERIGGQNNFTIYDTDDQKAVVKEVLKLLKLEEKQYPVKGVISAISKAKEKFLDPEAFARKNEWNFHDRNVAEIYKEYEKRLRKNNALDFDDLINRTIMLFQRKPDVLSLYHERFRYIMVDEYQDTNHAQFILVKLLASKYRNLCVVGDDDQSIYKFRGANIYNILNFEQEYPDAKVVRLEQNYRSTANILNAANAVIANNLGRKEKSLWTNQKAGEKLTFTRYESDRAEGAGFLRNVGMQQREGRMLADMAVLYRTNAQSRVLEEAMIREGLPYQIVGGTNFYARKEIRDLVGYLKVLNNPADDQSLGRIINVPRRGIGDTTVDKLRELAELHEMQLYDIVVDAEDIPDVGRSAAKVAAFGRMMQGLRELAEHGSLTELYRSLLEETQYRLLLQKENTDEARARIENIDELGNKIADFEQSRDNATLTELLEEISLVADIDNMEEEGDRLTLMTLHSAKGLEFPVVFMVGMEEGLFPSRLSIDSDDPDAVEEERRLCYVGITRAREKLYLSAAASRMLNGNYINPAVSRFIKEIPEEVLIKEGLGDDTEDREDMFDSFASSFRRSPVNAYQDSWQGTTFRQKPQAAGRKSSSPFTVGKSPSVKATAVPAGPFVPDYQVGDRVRHIKFGSGVVTVMEKGGADYEVEVNFDTAGKKRMFASLAKLRKV